MPKTSLPITILLGVLKQMLVNTAKEVKDVVVDNKKDDKDITDELINEDDENLNK